MKRKRKALGRIAAGLGALLATAVSAGAAEIVIVLDGSGSSVGLIGGVAKIDIARGALRTVLAGSPGDLAIGLVAYGHREREACSDIEVLTPPGPRDAFLAAINGVGSVGRSPIADATVAAAEALTDPDGATIVVITDNADNCAEDPCAIISALHERMPGLTVSVVGIAIPENEVAAISCFADITGGLYLRAGNAAQFQANLAQVLTAAWSEPAEPPPPMPTAAIAFPGVVVQGRAFSVAYEGPLAAGDEIRLAWAGSPPQDFLTAAFARADGGAVQLTAPVERGAFELRYWHAERATVLARVPIQIEAITPHLEAPQTVQQGADIVIRWEADIATGRSIQLADPFAPLDQAIATVPAIRNRPIVVLPAPLRPGTYELRLVDGPAAGAGLALRDSELGRILVRVAITVVAAEVVLEVEGPVVAGTDFAVAWTGPGGTGDEIRLARADTPATGFVDVAAAYGDVRLRAPFPPGRYELRYWSAAAQDIIRVATIDIVAPSATVEAPAAVGGGATFEVAWTGPAATGDRIVLLDANGGMVAMARPSLFGREVVFEAPVFPGTYELAYVTGEGGTTLVRQPITVGAPAATLSAPPSAVAGTTISVMWTGPAGRFDEIRITGPDESPTVRSAVRLTPGADAVLTAPAEPGRYRVIYWAGTAELPIATAALIVTCADCPVAPAGP